MGTGLCFCRFCAAHNIYDMSNAEILPCFTHRGNEQFCDMRVILNNRRIETIVTISAGHNGLIKI